MIAGVDFEVRPQSITLEERALIHDTRVREIDRVVRESWSELAAICIQVRDKQEWKFLTSRDRRSFHSFDEWLMDAAPVCRATVYKGMGILSVIAADLTPAEIADIEIGNASLLAQVSPAVRRDPEIIKAARNGKNSKQLRQTIRTKYASQHIELMVEKKLRFTTSQWERIEAAYEAYCLVEAGASLETFFEWVVSETQA